MESSDTLSVSVSFFEFLGSWLAVIDRYSVDWT